MNNKIQNKPYEMKKFNTKTNYSFDRRHPSVVFRKSINFSDTTKSALENYLGYDVANSKLALINEETGLFETNNLFRTYRIYIGNILDANFEILAQRIDNIDAGGGGITFDDKYFTEGTDGWIATNIYNDLIETSSKNGVDAINEINSNTNDLTNRVTTNESSITTINTDLTALTNRVTTNEEDFVLLTEAVTNNQTSITALTNITDEHTNTLASHTANLNILNQTLVSAFDVSYTLTSGLLTEGIWTNIGVITPIVLDNPTTVRVALNATIINTNATKDYKLRITNGTINHDVDVQPLDGTDNIGLLWEPPELVAGTWTFQYFVTTGSGEATLNSGNIRIDNKGSATSIDLSDYLTQDEFNTAMSNLLSGNVAFTTIRINAVGINKVIESDDTITEFTDNNLLTALKTKNYVDNELSTKLDAERITYNTDGSYNKINDGLINDADAPNIQRVQLMVHQDDTLGYADGAQLYSVIDKLNKKAYIRYMPVGNTEVVVEDPYDLTTKEYVDKIDAKVDLVYNQLVLD